MYRFCNPLPHVTSPKNIWQKPYGPSPWMCNLLTNVYGVESLFKAIRKHSTENLRRENFSSEKLQSLQHYVLLQFSLYSCLKKIVDIGNSLPIIIKSYSSPFSILDFSQEVEGKGYDINMHKYSKHLPKNCFYILRVLLTLMEL